MDVDRESVAPSAGRAPRRRRWVVPLLVACGLLAVAALMWGSLALITGLTAYCLMLFVATPGA